MERTRPVGYWLKQLDRLLEDGLDRLLGDEGLARRHWQALSTLARGPFGEGELASALGPFVRDDPAGLRTVLDSLAERGWTVRDDEDRLVLTRAGRDAQERILLRVRDMRGLTVQGISEDEYATVIDVLARMAANLERAAPPSGRHPGGQTVQD